MMVIIMLMIMLNMMISLLKIMLKDIENSIMRWEFLLKIMLDHIFYSFSYRGLQATSYAQVYDVTCHGNYQFISNYQFIRQFGLVENLFLPFFEAHQNPTADRC